MRRCRANLWENGFPVGVCRKRARHKIASRFEPGTFLRSCDEHLAVLIKEDDALFEALRGATPRGAEWLESRLLRRWRLVSSPDGLGGRS